MPTCQVSNLTQALKDSIYIRNNIISISLDFSNILILLTLSIHTWYKNNFPGKNGWTLPVVTAFQ